MQVSHILWRRQVMEENGAEGEKGLWDREALQGMLADYVYASTDNNATMDALRAALDKMPEAKAGRRRPSHIQAFSSPNKYGSMTFSDGTYFLGAPEFIMKDSYDAIAEEIASYVQKGYRLLLFAKQEADGILPLGYVTLSNPIRANAKETFSYFKEQDVAIRVISGDNPQTVSEVAKRAGIEGAENYVDAVERYVVFGRVTPKQKQLIVKALQEAGHTVAMTGDGVNDILAMKDADCSVAMASGSEACAQAAQVVLLDSDFAKMPEVVYEGRQVVNNVGRSASLFLVKNIFSLLMSVFSALFMITYPLEPSQISLISMFTIGIPGFLLALEPNRERIKGHFMRGVLVRALPAGLTDVLAVGALVICGQVFSLPSEDIATAATLLLCVVGFMILIKISKPMSGIKYAIVIGNIAGLIFAGIFCHQLFALSAMSKVCVLLMVVFAFAAESLLRYLSLLVEKIDCKF